MDEAKNKQAAEECIRNAETLDDGTEQILLKLFDIGAVKFGNFTLKSGVQSPIYIDLRYALVTKNGVKFDVICGVPYTALPVATVISLLHRIPMLMRRKEVKKYAVNLLGYIYASFVSGTKRIIEGVFKDGQTCLVVEVVSNMMGPSAAAAGMDLITSGMSVMETTSPLNDVGLKTTDVVVLVDREQGGATNLKNRGITPHAVLKISSMLKCLLKAERIDMPLVAKVVSFLQSNQVIVKAEEDQKKGIDSAAAVTKQQQNATRSKTYDARSLVCKNPAAKKLLKIMAEKKTNLCFSADITDKKRLIEVVDAVGPHICMLKTHIDTLEGFDMEVAKKLRDLAKKHNFLIFEDRKYADIGNTVVLQYSKGCSSSNSSRHIPSSRMGRYCQLSSSPRPGIVDGLMKNGGPAGRGLVLIAEMSSKGNLATGAYTEASVKMASEYPEFVMGFISMRKLTDNPGIIHMTPGVKLGTISGTDGLGQQYKTPHSVLVDKLSDVIIVGRGIYKAEDPANEAKKYREAGWSAYQKSLSS
eukprot:jgi/Bigna1/88701/estExt_fgenesh1_pg.C_370005